MELQQEGVFADIYIVDNVVYMGTMNNTTIDGMCYMCSVQQLFKSTGYLKATLSESSKSTI